MRQANRTRPQITLEGVNFIFRPNFQGREELYNAAGRRNFCIRLSEEQAAELDAQDYNVKLTKGNPDYDQEPEAYLKVSMAFTDRSQPNIYILTPRGFDENGEETYYKTKLDAETAMLVDYMRVREVDVTIRPWKHGRVANRPELNAAYLQTIFIYQDLDELEQKYIDVPEAPRDEQKTIGYDSIVSAEIVEDYEHPTFDVI